MVVQEEPVFTRRSYGLMPFTNGLAAAVYDSDQGFISGFYPHIYRRKDEDRETVNLIERAALGVRLAGQSTWLSDMKPVSQGYISGTGIVEVVHKFAGTVVTGWHFCPQEQNHRLLCTFVALENRGPEPITDASFYLYLALMVGSGASRTSHGWVEYHPSSGVVLVGGTETSHVMFGRAVRPRGAKIRFSSASGYELWNRLSRIAELRGGSEVWVGENLHCVYQGCLGTLPPGETLWAGVVIGYDEGLTFERANGLLDGYARDRTARELLQAEKDWWLGWQSPGRRGFREKDDLNLHQRSCTVLKMGQCREEGRPFGQILASMPPGHWNIAWVRDGAYSIAGLAAWGLLEEARAGLKFMLDADAGHYRQYSINGHEYGIGVPYRISVCRYFGGGREESDGEPPNIEIDGFGLFLWALAEYWKASHDQEFLSHYWPTVRDLVVAPLIRSIDVRGIVRPESGPWETHLPGASFAYTSICAACGLAGAALLAKQVGEAETGGEYQRLSDAVYHSVEREFMGPGGVLLGKPQYESAFYLDASVVEAINFGLAAPNAKWVHPTLEAFDRTLRIAPGRGFCRNNEPGEYNEQEWVFIDLRVAEAMVRVGRLDEAGKLAGWVMRQTRANGGLFAELYRREGAAYEGAVPMCGFGAGAYLLFERTLHDLGITLQENR